MTFLANTIWVTEEGTATSPPAVKQIDNKGNVTTMLDASKLPAAGTLVSPLTGIVSDRNWIYLVHRQTNSTNAPGVPVGAISRFRPNDPYAAPFKTLISGFPSFGYHPFSQIVFGPEIASGPTSMAVPRRPTQVSSGLITLWATFHPDAP